MKRDLNYYMNLPYRIEIAEVSEKEGGGIVLFIPELGRCSTTAWGETYEAAKAELEDIKRDLFSRCLEEGIAIPEPLNEGLQDFSGKLLLRMPKMMHRAIANMADENSISINACILLLITKGLTQEGICRDIQDQVGKGIQKALGGWSVQKHLHVHSFPECQEPPKKKVLEASKSHFMGLPS